MRFVPLYLALAVLLLWLPTGLFIGRRRRRELREPNRDARVSLPALLASVWSWVDIIRAGAGAWILVFLVQLPDILPLFGVEVKPNVRIPAAYQAGWIGFQLVTLVLGVWVQVMITGARRLRLAPLFYLLGLSIALPAWNVSTFGILLGLTLTGMLGRWNAVFWIMPIALAGFVALFRSINILSLLVPLLYGIPALLSIRPERSLAWIMSPRVQAPLSVDERNRRRRRRRRSNSLVIEKDQPAAKPPVQPAPGAGKP